MKTFLYSTFKCKNQEMYIDDKVMISLDDSLGMDDVNSISKADLISGKVFGFSLCQ